MSDFLIKFDLIYNDTRLPNAARASRLSSVRHGARLRNPAREPSLRPPPKAVLFDRSRYNELNGTAFTRISKRIRLGEGIGSKGG
jgi:hypothetical protein